MLMPKSNVKKKISHPLQKRVRYNAKKVNKRLHVKRLYAHKLAAHSKLKKSNKRIVILNKKGTLEKKGKKENGAKVISNALLIDDIIKDDNFSNYIVKVVGKRAIDILSVLKEPRTDEDLSTLLNVKINEVRRILNTLNTYGIAKYETNKDNKGWLTFKWYVNFENIKKVKDNFAVESKNAIYKLPDNCNDFFICESCFEKQRTLFPFETAIEMNFKCDCGGNLVRISREDAERLVEKEAATAHS
jgi:transcription initiation factor IIE alpha subunit